MAEHLAQAGAKVVISSRKAAPCEEVAARIRANGGEAASIPCHVGNPEHLSRLVEETNRQLGPIDVLICNAAANPYYGPLLDAPDEAYSKTLDINIQSVLQLCKLVMPDMAARGGGSVIVVSSVGAIRSRPGLGLYQISKAADLALVRALALEWGRQKVRVNSILPGLVKTDFARALWETPEAEDRNRQRLPLNRLGEPDDIGPAAVFLAAPASQWMTGQMLIIDGGSTVGNPA